MTNTELERARRWACIWKRAATLYRWRNRVIRAEILAHIGDRVGKAAKAFVTEAVRHLVMKFDELKREGKP